MGKIAISESPNAICTGWKPVLRMRNVTIIGAGPAGSTAGFLLAKNGWEVTIVEQQRFPRDKVCGESVSALGIEVLGRLGLAGCVEGIGPARLTRTVLHAMEGSSVSLMLPRAMWGVSRRAMDRVLLDAAAEAGARVLQPARCESMNGELVVRHLADNRIETLRPSWVLLADGKGALMPQRPRPTTDFGVKAHFECVDGARDAVELFGVRGHYVGLAPIEGGVSNIAFSVPAARLERFRGEFDGLWRQVLSENGELASRFIRARRIGGWLASPLPRFGVARRWPDKVIPLGNAAAALEPIGGEGMGLAMRSAELAAGALVHGYATGSPLPVKRLRGQFAKLWRKRRWGCRILAKLLGNAALAGPLLDWAASDEGVSRRVFAWMGKE